MNGEYECWEVRPNPKLACPPEILKQQVVIEVKYIGFDGLPGSGVIELNEAVVSDVKAFF